MRHYAVSEIGSPPGTAVSASANTATAALGIITGSARAAAVYELTFGCSAVAADATLEQSAYFCSALTAGVSITPVNISSNETASNTTASSAPTAPTRVGIAVLRIPFNSRATIRWAAVDPDSRIYLPANGVTNNGALQIENQQPGTVSSLVLNTTAYFAE